MKTPIPEPAYIESINASTEVFTEARLRAAMVAAYNEAIEDAANLVNRYDDCGKIVDHIRKLKKQP